MNARRVLIIVLLLVGALFAVGVIAGQRSESAASSEKSVEPATWTEWLVGVLSASTPGDRIALTKVLVEPDGVRLDESTLSLAAGQAAKLKVGRDSTRDFRSLVLKFESGPAVRVSMSIEGEETSKQFQAGEETTITWRRAGGEVALEAIGTSGSSRIRFE